MTILLRNTFKAWIDRPPGAPPRLIMVGDVRVPTDGWQALHRLAFALCRECAASPAPIGREGIIRSP